MTTQSNVRAGALLESISGSPDLRRALAYVLLKPDVVLRDLFGELSEILEHEGYCLLEFRIGSMPEEFLVRIYRDTFRWDVDSWNRNAEAYRYGPAMGLLLRRDRDTDGEPSAQEALRRTKGAALPGSFEPETLRARLRATSRVFNVLHVSDTFELAMEESCLWLGRACFEAALPEPRPGGEPADSWARAAGELSKHGYTLSHLLDGEATFMLVKRRLVHAIERQISRPDDSSGVLAALGQQLDSAVSQLLAAQGDFADRRNVLRIALEREEWLWLMARKALTEHAESASDLRLLERTVDLLLELNALTREREKRLEFFWHLLSSWRVFSSDLEKYLVFCSLVYPSAMPS